MQRPQRPVPFYRKSDDCLDKHQLELFKEHASCLTHCISQNAAPYVVTSNMARSTDWLRIIHGRYMLLASSTPDLSVLELFTVPSLLSGERANAVATAYLSGPVSTGEVDVQETQVIIALCLNNFHPKIAVLSARHDSLKLTFCELAVLKGLSHIRCLQGDFIGCAASTEFGVPCVVNWRTQQATPLFSDPLKEGGCLAIKFMEEYIALATTSKLYIIEQTSHMLTVKKTFDFEFDASSVVISDVSPAGEPETFPVLATSASGTFLYNIFLRDELSLTLSAQHIPPEPRVGMDFDEMTPYYFTPNHARLGHSALRPFWIWTPVSDSICVLDSLIVSEYPRTTAPCELPIVSNFDSASLPALFGMPVLDFDDGVGLLAIGNIFGEFAVCSYGGPWLEGYEECLVDLPLPPIQGDSDFECMSLEPIEIEFGISSRADGWEFLERHEKEMLQYWNRFKINERVEGCRDTWDEDDCDNFLGSLGDISWILEHDYHLYYRPIPILYASRSSAYILKVGRQHVLVWDEEPKPILFPVGITPKEIAEKWRELPQRVRLKADLVSVESRERYQVMHRVEVRSGRNRWGELRSRGADWVDEGFASLEW